MKNSGTNKNDPNSIGFANQYSAKKADPQLSGAVLITVIIQKTPRTLSHSKVKA